MEKLPKIGVFEIPMGCEARTNEWIFPSNRQVDKYLPPDHDPSSLPPLHIFQDIAGLETSTTKGVIQLHSGNDSVLERSKKVLEETNRIFVRTQFTRQQIEKRLEDLQQEASREYRYPYEWVLFMIPQIEVIVFLLIGHFRHDNLLWSVNNSLAVVRSYVIRGSDTEYETPDQPLHTSMRSMPSVHLPEEVRMLPIPSTTSETRIPRRERSKKP